MRLLTYLTCHFQVSNSPTAAFSVFYRKEIPSKGVNLYVSVMEFSVGEYTIHSFHISDHLTQIHKPLFIYHMLLCTVKWGDFRLPGDFGQAVVY